MDTFNKAFRVQCVLSVVTCLLGNAHFEYVMNNGGYFSNATENNSVISSTKEHNEMKNNLSNQSDNADSTVESIVSSSDAVTIEHSSSGSKPENSVPQSFDEKKNPPHSEDTSHLVGVSRSKPDDSINVTQVNTSSENETRKSSVSISYNDNDDDTTVMEKSTHEPEGNTCVTETNPSLITETSSISTPADSTVNLDHSNDSPTTQNASSDSQTEKPVPQGDDQINNSTCSDNTSVLVGVSAPEPGDNIKVTQDDISSSSVSTINPNPDGATFLLETSTPKSYDNHDVAGTNPSFVTETSSISTPADSTVDLDRSNDGTVTRGSLSDLQTEEPVPQNDNQINNSTFFDNTSSLVGISAPEPGNNIRVTQEDINSTNGTPLSSVSTTNINPDDTTLSLETSKPQSDDNADDVTETNPSLITETSSISKPVDSIVDSDHSNDNATIQGSVLDVQTEEPVPQSDDQINNSNSSDGTNVMVGVSRAKFKGNINVTQVNISSTNETSVPLTSTSAPDLDYTTHLLEANTPKLEDNINVTQENISSTKETPVSSVSTPKSNPDDTTSLLETSTPEPYDDHNETDLPVIPTMIPNHIMKVSKRNNTSVHNTSLVSSAGDEVVRRSSTNSNITPVVDIYPNTTQISFTENPSDKKISTQAETTIKTTKPLSPCSSTVRASLINSFSKTFIDVLKQLVGMFINALDETFEQVFQPLLPSLLEKIKSILNNIRTDVDNEVDTIVNHTLKNMLKMKSFTFSAIGNSEQWFDSNSQKFAYLELNYTISEIFKTIELCVSELSMVTPVESILTENAQGDILTLMDHAVDDFLNDVNEVAVDDVVNSTIVKNSSLDMTHLVDEFLNKSISEFEQFFNSSESSANNTAVLVGDLMKITQQYKNTFATEIDSLLVDSLIEVNDKKGLFDKLLKDILLVLRALRNNLFEDKINRALNTTTFAGLDAFENSSLSKIKNIRSRIIEKDPHSEYSEIQINLHFIEDSVRNSINAVRPLFKNLRGVSKHRNNGSVNSAFSLIESSLYDAIFSLQKEVPPLLDIHFFSRSSSFNMGTLNSTYKNILKEHSKQLYLCENSSSDFSTSRGIFTHPFEYLMVFTVLVNLVMW